MENRIIAGYLKDFKNDFEIEEEGITKIFEKFANYCIISRIHPEAFSSDDDKLDDMDCGGGNDTGIDGLAIIVNEHLVSDIDEISYLLKISQRFDVQFVFIQSKTSSEFKTSEIGNFTFGVKDFFKNEATIKNNENIKRLRELKNFIYDHSIDMERSPICSLYYVTTGKWANDQNVAGRIESERKEIENSQLFSRVEFVPVDADGLEKIYKEIKNKVTKEINFDKQTPLPRIDDVQEAYIGILSVKEYFKLICGSDGRIQKNLFYDNVRDYQGLNSVNSEIAQTIKDIKQQDKFALLNNGVTIVAKSINKVGTYFKIKDFQIVNGCQSSHILFYHQNHIQSENVYLPLKLIVTDNSEVSNQIIKATNRQTEVKVEAFESLKEFHKKLEEFYLTFDKENRIYYERRPRQYENSIPPVKKAKVITLAAQINSYVSMFLNEPHSTHRYYGELLNAYESRLFQDNQSYYMYYVSSFGLYTIETMFKVGKINTFYKKFKYHMLVAFRIIVGGFAHPNMTSNKMNDYCIKIHRILLDKEKAAKMFLLTISVIANAVKTHKLKHGDRSNLDLKRIRTFTSEVLEESKKYQVRE